MQRPMHRNTERVYPGNGTPRPRLAFVNSRYATIANCSRQSDGTTCLLTVPKLCPRCIYSNQGALLVGLRLRAAALKVEWV